ncbi:ABC transporter substrate-binding protein [Rothia sp. (in: high G+C Gram-positive bacteria)]|uniref:ABC transporter substrate-binding protein n=1 Tax=Rothia sp. (in: high G+C Gram-positive bacteria) TaxID=1885016 RepID=UPI001CAC1032|nr:ABC transporter substrate-binding protein [Rothia sp. (in: high G+C Gram-positive bacteria)]MBF1655910.1 ABC transporter substrate-binding protein [Rothia sp. (in: high G+C Gram-positive bacteria)]
MQHQPYASSAVGNSDALLRATAGSSGLSRRAVLRFGALFSAGLALSACSGQSSAGSSTGSSASASASSANARRVFRFAQGAAPLGLDPALFPVASTYQVTAQVLQTLLVANHYTGDPEVQDSLCSEWTVSDDRLVHTFVLREAHFSNGSALSADAVVQNFQRWQALATGEGTVALAVPAQPLFAWGFGVPKPGSIDPSAVEPAPVQASPSGAATPGATASVSASASASASPSASATASETATPSASASASASAGAHAATQPDDKKTGKKADAQSSAVQSFLPLVSSVVAKDNSVVVTLSRPSLAFPRILTQQAFGIIDPSLFGSDQKLTGNPVGTGAFRVESFKDGTVRLLKNTHFDGQQPELDEIQISTLTSSDKRYFALMEGHIDACDQVNSSDLGQLARDGYQTPGRDPFSLVYLSLNTAHPVLKNISVRRAISHAVDRGALRQYYPQGTSDAQTLISPSFRIKADDAKDYTDRNQDMARSLLATAGYDNQVIECYYPADVSLPWMDTPQKVYSEMVASLIEVGLNIKPVPLPWAEYLPKSREVSSERGITLAGFYGMYRDPYAFFGPVLAPLIAEHQMRSLIANAPSDMTTGLTKKTSDVPSSGGSDSNVRISATPSPQPSYSPDPLTPEEEASASASPSPSATPSPQPTAVAVAPSPRFTEILEAIRTADSADSVDSQRELYAKVVSQLGQFMPAVPLLNVTSKVAVSREVQGYQTEQNAIELFGKLRKS